ncbi:hypothetical protein CBS147321_4922 [Aspergillus niger]|nr:hypothetical protein CBS147321_4922 [Aspergillus niger]
MHSLRSSPTTVTLTLPATNRPSALASSTSSPNSPEDWTTTVSVCTDCGPTPTTVTVTIPVGAATGVDALTASPSGSQPAGESSPGQSAPTAPASTAPTTTETVIVVPSQSSTSQPVILGTGSVRASSTFHIQPSQSGSRVPVAPSGTAAGVSPVFTGAASRVSRLQHGAGAVSAFALFLLAAI